MSEELKPCPFCGGKAQHQWHSGPCWIECETCNAVGPADAETTTEQTEVAWNTRTPPPPQHREPIEADREAVHRRLRAVILNNAGQTLVGALMDGLEGDGGDDWAGTLYPAVDRLADAAIAEVHRLAFSTPAASDTGEKP